MTTMTPKTEEQERAEALLQDLADVSWRGEDRPSTVTRLYRVIEELVVLGDGGDSALRLQIGLAMGMVAAQLQALLAGLRQQHEECAHVARCRNRW
jgi:hypothetical protein